jgi:hypothetical protein
MTAHRQLVAPASIAGAAVLALTALTGMSPAAGESSTAAPVRATHTGGPVVVARGLNNPRQLTYHRGAVYVAESGKGGAGPCVVGGEGDRVCLGSTGAVTRIRDGRQRRVLTGLPSTAGADGSSASGPASVRFDHGRYVLTVGAGIDTAARARLGHRARLLGTVLRGTWGRHHRPHLVADIVRFERRHNPDHSVAHDSNPNGFAPSRAGYLVVDSGGNDLLRVRRGGRIHTLAVFPNRMVSLPPQVGGGTAPMQAVPTSVTRGPEGAFYVSQLTGFPFPEGGARIWRVRPGHRPTVFATGLTNVTDLAWEHGRLYAVQLTDHGLLAATGLPMGSLIRVHRGNNVTPDVVAGSLPAPYGLATHGDHAWVSVCSVCAGGGEVLRVPLR